MFTNYKKQRLLNYTIYDYSSFSNKLYPHYIQTDNPLDSSSRWTTGHSDETQFIILKLDKPAIITNIIFGKYTKIHSCNIKNFLVYSKQNDEWLKILSYKLRNDTEKECICLDIENNDRVIITEYIKIVPLSSWGMNYTFSMWYLELRGFDTNLELYYEWNKKKIYDISTRLVLKFLREKNFTQEFNSLEQKVGVLECKELKKMRKLLEDKRIDKVEEEIFNCARKGVFKEYIAINGYKGKWKMITADREWPSKRGGHQMVCAGNKIFLLGGYNGREELGDLWMFDGKWKLISEDTQQVGGPGKRSCHKMVYSKKRNALYVMGKYIPNDYQRDSYYLKFEIYKYLIDKNQWILENNSLDMKIEIENFYDHQMSLDFNEECVYIVGGKITIKNEQYYGGIYIYKIEERKWNVIRDNNLIDGTPKFKGRVGHNLIYIPPNYFKKDKEKESIPTFPPEAFNNSLIIIGGVRNREFLKEVLFYSISNDTIYKRVPLPSFCSDRSIMRTELVNNELFCVFTISKDQDNTEESMLVYTYSLLHKEWQELHIEGISPCPRSAHQFLCSNDAFYLFGGKKTAGGEERMNDLWKLEIFKEDEDSIARKLIFQVRKYNFLLLAGQDESLALEYLQTKVHESVDHTNADESQAFKKLCCEIYFQNIKIDPNDVINEISNYFPAKSRAPTLSIYSFL